MSIITKSPHVLVTTGVVCGILTARALTPTQEELNEASQWAAAKFGGVVQKQSNEAGLIVRANHDPVQLNSRAGKPLRIKHLEFTHGLYCHAPSQVLVRLPEGALTFTASVGVDSNDQTMGGRGSVQFLVKAGNEEKFKTGILHEGMEPVPISVNLNGTTEFTLEIGDGGDGISCDQADWANAQVTLLNGKTVWLGDLPLMDGSQRAPYSTEPFFSFNYGGKDSGECLAEWGLKRESRKLDDQRTAWTLRSLDPKTGLEVRCEAIQYNDFPTVEWTVYLKNTSSNNSLLLTNLQALNTRLERNGKGDFTLHHNKGTFVRADDFEPLTSTLGSNDKLRFAPPGGRGSGRVWPYFNLESVNEGTIIVVGWPGQWAAHFQRDDNNGTRVIAGQELVHLRLHPGEEIRTPLIVLQFWKGDWIRAQNIWRRWMLAHNLPRSHGQLPATGTISPCSSHQFAEMVKADEACQKLFIDRYIEEGFAPDYWWMDAGWYFNKGDWTSTGTWEVDTNRFPHGLRAVTDHGHAKNVKSIVWFEPERVTPGSWLFETHPEWLLNGYQPKDGPPSQKLLNLGNPEALDWLIEHTDKLIISEGIDLYRQDYNIDPLDFWNTNDPTDRQGITENHYITGYLAFWDELRRRHPDMLIDSCASGGHRNDLETMRRSIPLLRSDFIFNATGNQGHCYGLSFWLPYQGTGTSPAQFSLYDLRSNATCPNQIPCWDLRDRNLNYDFLRKAISTWRSYAPYYMTDFYPLSQYTLSSDGWMAWQFNAPEKNSGMVQAFRRENSAFEVARFKLKGLEASAHYVVTDVDAPETSQEYSGTELMEKGLRVTMTNQPAATVLIYKKKP
jgi:alpha-galactosidase